jgi:alkaline phosphatase D
VASFAARRAGAYQAYHEHMPLRASMLTEAMTGLAGGAEMRIHHQVRFGQLATFYLVDDRPYRDRHACARGGKSGSSTVNPATCAEWMAPNRSLLGTTQERWLDGAFAHAGKRWNILGLQTLFGQRDFKSGIAYPRPLLRAGAGRVAIANGRQRRRTRQAAIVVAVEHQAQGFRCAVAEDRARRGSHRR